MEWRNNGMLVFEKILTIFDYIAITNFAIHPYPVIPVPIFPLFQHANLCHAF